ncbi:MAG: HEPN domain-containing protein [Nitrospirae bacterium]|nr:HEPN domain-containing protein [Nitrospirota bacterium]
MEGKEFLELAKRLQNSEDEAERRTSVSRAYYALFNHVKSFLNIHNIKLPRTAQAHESAHLYLSNSGIEEAEDLADTLNNLREKRNDADYELISPKYNHNKVNCGFTCVKAIQFVNRFDKINPASLVKGILEYMKQRE